MISGIYKISNSKKVNPDIIKSMHRFSYKVFFQELGGREGLLIENEMEFDTYDTENAHYIAKLILRYPKDISFGLP